MAAFAYVYEWTLPRPSCESSHVTKWALIFASSLLVLSACSGDDDDDSTVKDRDAGQAVRDAGDNTPRDGGDVTGRDGGTPRDAGDNTPRDGGMRDGGVSTSGLDNRPPNPTCTAPMPPNNARVQIQTTAVYQSAGSFNRPIFALQAPGDGTRWYVVEQAGRVLVFDDVPTPGAADTFVDIRGTVDDGPNEAGLLGMAFHPDYANNGYVYLSYTTGGPLTSRIVRYTVNGAGTALQTNTAFEIYSIRQPFGNHNGGMIAFGPDGHLYFGLGDGGSGGDPLGAGQDITTDLGAILRLDVDGGSPYAIPPTNPFYQVTGRDEIYAYGLRNPWRFSFDRVTGELWAGDVGQNRLEEVDIVQLGGNYGWNIREGDRCYNNPNCDSSGLIDPVATYGRGEGQSITGGYVYRGTQVPGLEGVYLYADFVSGRLWGLFENLQTGEYEDDVLLNTGQNIASFAEGVDGELYIMTFGGQMLQIQIDGNPPVDNFPTLLSQTGCVDTNDPTVPVAAMIPYEVNAPLWSDDATKRRWFAVPDGETITVGADGDFDFPNGSVLMKEFSVNGQRVETRLMMRHMDGTWAGYTYEWNDTETEATLLESSKRVDVNGTTWRIPSRGECMGCHTSQAGRSLGLEVAQQNAPFTYPRTARTANQLETYSEVGFLTSPIGDVTQLDSLPSYGDMNAPLEERVRGYLHSNCANCHRMDGVARGMLDMRYDVALGDTGLCDPPLLGDYGLNNPLVVAPGNPQRSMLSFRMGTLEAPRMPPLGSEIVDSEGVTLVNGWINALNACP